MSKQRTFISRGLWLLILLPLAALVVAGIGHATRQPLTESTGDPLLDELISLIEADLLTTKNSDTGIFDMYQYGVSSLFSDDEFNGWEERFGDDPRYWLLRYYLAPDPAYSDLDPPPPDPVTYLYNAACNGISSAEIDFQMFFEYEKRWNYEATELTEDTISNLPTPTRIQGQNATYAEQAGYYKAKYKLISDVIDELHGADFDQLQQQMLDSAGEEAMPYYFAAMLSTERGDYGSAKEYLRLGNLAESNSRMIGFPLTELIQAHRSGGEIGNPLVTGYLSELFAMKNLSMYYIRWKNFTKVLSVEACNNNDMELLDEIHRFGCRIGSQSDGDLMLGIVGMTFSIFPNKAYEQMHNGIFNEKQTQAFAEYQTVRNKLKAATRTTNSNLPAIYGSSTSPGSIASAILLMARRVLSLGASGKIDYLHNWRATTRAEQNSLVNNIHPLYEEFEQFSYSDLGWE